MDDNSDSSLTPVPSDLEFTPTSTPGPSRTTSLTVDNNDNATQTTSLPTDSTVGAISVTHSGPNVPGTAYDPPAPTQTGGNITDIDYDHNESSRLILDHMNLPGTRVSARPPIPPPPPPPPSPPRYPPPQPIPASVPTNNANTVPEASHPQLPEALAALPASLYNPNDPFYLRLYNPLNPFNPAYSQYNRPPGQWPSLSIPMPNPIGTMHQHPSTPLNIPQFPNHQSQPIRPPSGPMIRVPRVPPDSPLTASSAAGSPEMPARPLARQSVRLASPVLMSQAALNELDTPTEVQKEEAKKQAPAGPVQTPSVEQEEPKEHAEHAESQPQDPAETPSVKQEEPEEHAESQPQGPAETPSVKQQDHPEEDTEPQPQPPVQAPRPPRQESAKDAEYRRKCLELVKQVREMERANDELQKSIMKRKANVQRYALMGKIVGGYTPADEEVEPFGTRGGGRHGRGRGGGPGGRGARGRGRGGATAPAQRKMDGNETDVGDIDSAEEDKADEQTEPMDVDVDREMDGKAEEEEELMEDNKTSNTAVDASSGEPSTGGNHISKGTEEHPQDNDTPLKKSDATAAAPKPGDTEEPGPAAWFPASDRLQFSDRVERTRKWRNGLYGAKK
ncbi:hypothetical protein BJ508DRAFT_324480 [Ascobolus immersus RN42]|uniref:Uncharacterized protein n=1 Tax=Ascobolus immersus RN42 TaxID=1160509 RepID=A0A3N4IGY0_ASCIM|nr:hypothetical protein BJ508DRAFT_324480 [Ascobolus immersus RN42]